jgi:hypothetical protein
MLTSQDVKQQGDLTPVLLFILIKHQSYGIRKDRPLLKLLARSKKKVLNDATNKKKTTKEKTTTAPKKLDEDQWRGHVLAFYKSDLPQSTYIETNKIKSHPLRTRFDKSGLRNLKKCNTPYSDAVIQYDFWFKQ